MDDWLQSLQQKKVTVWLSSGSTVTGVVEGLQIAGPVGERDRARPQSSAYCSELPVLRINNARLALDARGQEQEADFVLIPVERIGLIIPAPEPPKGEPDSSGGSK